MTDTLKDKAVAQLKAKREEREKTQREELRSKDATMSEMLKRSQDGKEEHKPKYDIDKMQLYLGEPYVLNEKITILQPTVGDLIRNGEQQCYSVVHLLTANTTSYRLMLWDMGIDWCKISDFELFQALVSTMEQPMTQFLFGDLDFSKLRPYQQTLEDKTQIVLYDPEQDFLIDEETYNKLAWYVRNIFNIFPKEEFAKGKHTKEAIIDEDRFNYERHKDEQYHSILLPLISACLNHPGFKYSKKELVDVGIVEFMDSVQRLQIYESATALLKGAYSGFMDTSKIKADQFNFMRNIDFD